ncbi:MAG: hypothetical protein JO353_09640 [Phycisphaerae bacterium]|nr:hypothetical protein [Phycisphaerae bacterium]
MPTDTPASPPPPIRSGSDPSIISLLIWLLIQLIVLSLGAARVALTARAGVQPQHLAMAEMIAAQMGIAALARRWLFEADRFAVIGSAIVFLMLAGWLTATPALVVVWIAIDVSLWLLAGMCVRSSDIAAVFLPAIAVGLPIIRYLILDFGERDGTMWWWIDPLSSTIRQSNSAEYFWPAPMISLLLILVSAIAM